MDKCVIKGKGEGGGTNLESMFIPCHGINNLDFPCSFTKLANSILF